MTTLEESDWAWCQSALVQVSRTFSQPIQMLPPDLERAVTCGYLLCRLVDTIEDHPILALTTRDALYAAFLDVLERRAAPAVLKPLALAAFPESNHETELFQRLDAVHRVLHALPVALQDGVLPWVAEMTRGMAIYSHRSPGSDGISALLTEPDLERYCYFVAGTVGHMLTDLFVAALPDLDPARERTMRQTAESFALGLQLTNILKDVTDDIERRVVFVPRTLCAAAGIAPAELCEPRHRAAAHAAVAPVFETAQGALHGAFTYALAIPPEAAALRLFCLLPLWMAVRTLVLARGNDAQFDPGTKVKIERTEVYGLIAECTRLVADDAALREAFRALWTS